LRVFKTRRFARFARDMRISDAYLCGAVWRAECGLIEADLGVGVIRQRVAWSGQGRAGGYRVLIAYRARARSVFLFGFAKNERANVDDDELATLRDIAKAWFAADDKALQRAVVDGSIRELAYDKTEDQPAGEGPAEDG
jgi:hypothetical protein